MTICIIIIIILIYDVVLRNLRRFSQQRGVCRGGTWRMLLGMLRMLREEEFLQGTSKAVHPSRSLSLPRIKQERKFLTPGNLLTPSALPQV